MKSSGNSSAHSQPIPPQATPPTARSRKRFALTGPSRPFDPRTTAARADIADVRLAETIFAPHYAAHILRTVVLEADVTATKGGEKVGAVSAGDIFEVLEITTGCAWGVAPRDGTVGFVPLSALATQ